MADAWAIMDRLFRTEGGSPELLRLERDLYILKGGYLWWSCRYDDAEYMLRAAVRKALAIGEPEPVIKAGVQMCYLAIQCDDAKHSPSARRSSGTTTKKAGMRKWEGTALRFMGISRILLAQYDEADRYLLMSTSVFEKLEEKGCNLHRLPDSGRAFPRRCAARAEEDKGGARALRELRQHRRVRLALPRPRPRAPRRRLSASCFSDATRRPRCICSAWGKIYNIMHTEWEGRPSGRRPRLQHHGRPQLP